MRAKAARAFNLRRKRGATRKRKVQKHAVRGTLEVPQLSKAGSSLRLELSADGKKIGELVIGRGSLYWYGRGRKTSKRISWSRLADIMDEIAYDD